MKENQEYEKIELRSNEVQEILSRPPKWIVRWGITIIFLVIAILILGSWVFKYPTIITADIVLTTENPPAPIVAKTSGKIQNLFVKDKKKVIKNEVIGVLENPADYLSIDELTQKLEIFEKEFKQGEQVILQPVDMLGEIQPYFATFFKYIQDYNKTLSLDYYLKKIALYKQELKKFDSYLENLRKQNEILFEEMKLERNQFNRDSILYTKELMSESDYEQSKANLLSMKYSYEQNKLFITNTEIQIESLNQSILELELQEEKQISEQVNLIWESYHNLISSIDSWRHKYVLISPTNGVVTFNEFWNENQTVKLGETVVTVIPEDEGEIIGKVKLDFQGAGKVKVGQQANIQFANYPYMEFGMIKGEVRSISLAPNNNFYSLEIYLPNGLTTFYDVDLDFKQEMKGKAEIITEDIRLIERIIRPLRLVLNKNTKFGDKK